ncbi:MAG: hypothetical protein DMD41_09810 [Gemmatimonadetes bacterium]|nr:MAG: hypothetical protein DMD41_09810 [Gemmatimonadota bacterium]
MKLTSGTVFVHDAPFATYTLEAVDEPAKLYGTTHVLHVRPVLDRQGESGWFEQYRPVRAAIHAHLGGQN